jgi:hypothetical protein
MGPDERCTLCTETDGNKGHCAEARSLRSGREKTLADEVAQGLGGCSSGLNAAEAVDAFFRGLLVASHIEDLEVFLAGLLEEEPGVPDAATITDEEDPILRISLVLVVVLRHVAEKLKEIMPHWFHLVPFAQKQLPR